MYKDLLAAKAHQIDENTKEIIKKQSEIILALDGQDPGEGYPAIWAFTDLISNRLLRTTIKNSMPSEQINKEIQQILVDYSVNLAGIVSDKQKNII